MDTTKLLIVESEILPKVYEKVIEAKKLLQNKDALTIQEACKMADLSRSAFYKYKDCVFDYTTQEKGKIIILFMILKHAPGVLSDIINSIASVKGNIITINQNIPIRDTATLTITIDVKSMDMTPEDLIHQLMGCKGCKKIEIVGME